MMPVRRTQGWLPGILDDFFGNEWVDKTTVDTVTGIPRLSY